MHGLRRTLMQQRGGALLVALLVAACSTGDGSFATPPRAFDAGRGVPAPDSYAGLQPYFAIDLTAMDCSTAAAELTGHFLASLDAFDASSTAEDLLGLYETRTGGRRIAAEVAPGDRGPLFAFTAVPYSLGFESIRRAEIGASSWCTVAIAEQGMRNALSSEGAQLDELERNLASLDGAGTVTDRATALLREILRSLGLT